MHHGFHTGLDLASTPSLQHELIELQLIKVLTLFSLRISKISTIFIRYFCAEKPNWVVMDADKISNDAQPKSQSSCELCQRRKVRCDKGNPCSTCKRMGVKCEIPARRRLPRGRNGGRRKGDTDLKARIAKLENLVSSLGGETRSNTNLPSARPEPKRDEAPQKEPITDMSRYLGSSFWSNLSSEVCIKIQAFTYLLNSFNDATCELADNSFNIKVHGLREVLDESSDSGSETPERSEAASTPPGMTSRGFNFVLCGPDSWLISPNALDNPPRHMIEFFYNLYFQNVDPIFKVLHRPSMAEFMLRGNPYLNYKPGDPAVEALSFAIYYAGLSTLDAQKCKQRFGEEKSDLLNKYRFACEVTLARADFINTTKIAVLQAFVIFLVRLSAFLIFRRSNDNFVVLLTDIIFTFKASIRVNDRSRWSWTLLALAVRLSQALDLHTKEGPTSRKPFETEMRRRLWHQIGVLDINAAIDRGTEPMLAGKIKGIDPPANINDEDIFPDMSSPITSREGFTDMSFCLMSNEAEPLIRELVYPSEETANERFAVEQGWHKKQESK